MDLRTRFFLILITALAPTLALSQDCEYSSNEVDEFTKVSKRITEYQTVSNHQGEKGTKHLSFYLSKFSMAGVSSKKLHILMQKRGGEMPCFNNESKLMIMTQFDSVLTLPYSGKIECASANTQASQYGAYTDYSLFGYFNLTEEQIAFLRKTNIKKVRIYTTKGYYDYEIEDKIGRTWGGFTIDGDKKYHPPSYFIRSLPCID